MNIKQLFDSQSRDSEKLAAELEAHQATWPEVERRYNELDAGCIELAQQLSAQKLAGSPRAFQTEAQLKVQRWKRDGIKSASTRERDRLHHHLEELTLPVIAPFAKECVERVRNLGDEYRYERIRGMRDDDGRRVGYAVTIATNAAALGRLRDSLLQAMGEVSALRHRPLKEIHAAIKEWKKRFEAVDLLELVEEEVSERAAADRKPVQSGGPVTHGMLQPPGVPNIIFKNPARIEGLAARISKLEKGV